MSKLEAEKVALGASRAGSGAFCFTQCKVIRILNPITVRNDSKNRD